MRLTNNRPAIKITLFVSELKAHVQHRKELMEIKLPCDAPFLITCPLITVTRQKIQKKIIPKTQIQVHTGTHKSSMLAYYEVFGWRDSSAKPKHFTENTNLVNSFRWCAFGSRIQEGYKYC